jgi:hypothetical protein
MVSNLAMVLLVFALMYAILLGLSIMHSWKRVKVSGCTRSKSYFTTLYLFVWI